MHIPYFEHGTDVLYGLTRMSPEIIRGTRHILPDAVYFRFGIIAWDVSRSCNKWY